jgi:putative transcriptional regulator
MTNKYKTMSAVEQIKAGLEDSIAYSRGELSLKTTTLPLPPPKAKAEQIAELRKRLRMSQSVFAATLNVSPRTVQSWEQGVRQPAAALRMLQVIRERPQVVRMIFSSAGDSGRRTVRRPFRRNGATRRAAGPASPRARCWRFTIRTE